MTSLRTQKSKRKASLVASSVAVGAVGILFVILFGYFVMQPVLAPFDSVRVPPNCTTSLSHLPESRDYTIPGNGRGTLLAENTSTAVVVAAYYGKAPFIAHAYVIDKASKRIIRTFDFHNDIVDAGFDGDTLYLFNDKLGYFVATKMVRYSTILSKQTTTGGYLSPTTTDLCNLISQYRPSHMPGM